MTKAKRVAPPSSATVIDWRTVPTTRIDYEADATVFAQGEPDAMVETFAQLDELLLTLGASVGHS
jgi:hypothetical protein